MVDLLKKDKIVVHHSASPVAVRTGGKTMPVDANIIRNWHLANGWSDIGYNYVILPDGRCEEGRPLNLPGAHCKAGGRNFIGIGVCLVGNFSLIHVPEAQLEGLVTKILRLMAEHELKLSDVELHREVPESHTECPGKYFPADEFRKRLKERIKASKEQLN